MVRHGAVSGDSGTAPRPALIASGEEGTVMTTSTEAYRAARDLLLAAEDQTGCGAALRVAELRRAVQLGDRLVRRDRPGQRGHRAAHPGRGRAAELPKTISDKIRRVELRDREADAARDGTVLAEWRDDQFPELRA